MLMLTCPYGLSNILNNEIKKLGYTPIDTFDTGTFIDAGLEEAYRINLHSRIANKVFLRLRAPEICTNFDDLFSLTESIDRSQYIPKKQGISVKVHLRQSIIDSGTSAQSIIHKAIITKLTGSKDIHRDIDEGETVHTIFVVINKNICSLYLNTSGASLHERGYREQTGEAPLKENIAAALVHLANRNYNDPLIDPCCGAGTICIEAAMIARNIAPGLDRYFAFEQFPCYDKPTFAAIRKEAESNIYKKNYTIIGSDIDEQMVEYAKANAKNAQVLDTIDFKYGDVTKHKDRELSLSGARNTVVTNPPYGLRLEENKLDTLEAIHSAIALSMNKKTVVITGFTGAKKIFDYTARSFKNTKNGSEEVKVYLSK